VRQRVICLPLRHAARTPPTAVFYRNQNGWSEYLTVQAEEPLKESNASLPDGGAIQLMTIYAAWPVHYLGSTCCQAA
jgi:hypothetical protein